MDPRTISCHVPSFVLILSGCLKAIQIAGSGDPFALILGSYLLTLVTISLEILVGTWLWSGDFRKSAKFVATSIFTCFFCFSMIRFAAGYENCGCFGIVKVSPLVSMVVSATALVCLWQCASRKTRKSNTERQMVWMFGATLTSVACIASAANRPVELPADGRIRFVGKSVVLHPDKWIGSPLPIQDYLLQSQPLSVGSWDLLIYHEHCKACQQEINRRSRLRSNQGHSFALVSLEPIHERPDYARNSWNWFQLDSRFDWFAEAPVIVTVVNGIVTQVESRQDLGY